MQIVTEGGLRNLAGHKTPQSPDIRRNIGKCKPDPNQMHMKLLGNTSHFFSCRSQWVPAHPFHFEFALEIMIAKRFQRIGLRLSALAPTI